MKQTPNVAEPVEKAHAQQSATKQASQQPQPQGASWQFYFVVIVIMLGVMGIVGKVLGLF